jgi:hypothetical protein
MPSESIPTIAPLKPIHKVCDSPSASNLEFSMPPTQPKYEIHDPVPDGDYLVKFKEQKVMHGDLWVMFVISAGRHKGREVGAYFDSPRAHWVIANSDGRNLLCDLVAADREDSTEDRINQAASNLFNEGNSIVNIQGGLVIGAPNAWESTDKVAAMLKKFRMQETAKISPD